MVRILFYSYMLRVIVYIYILNEVTIYPPMQLESPKVVAMAVSTVITTWSSLLQICLLFSLFMIGWV